ncbi:SAM-dependent methyltransferase [Synechococcus sp. CS-1329]|uniref:MnmC family methyltransferase n=1 Tax=Synechococcus sp. CS-1329 TaxID=2847975 RepID=UPI00223A716A|nr:MnmC family methyltransferase [Synechococcus sp. CS-1329]MCT0219850.1 SAM-dependent methyltransferase [Synechococcus sp. CS-1329]
MTPKAPATGHLSPRITDDGSFSLHSAEFAEGFHSRRGALLEAHCTYVNPAQLERFSAGEELTLVDVCVGLGTNSAALLEAAVPLGIRLRWFGLEIDPSPLALALAQPCFRRQWQPALGLDLLQQLQTSGRWLSPHGRGEMLWGDARGQIEALLGQVAGRCDLVMLDAFSPRHCPQLWSQEFLAALSGLLAPRGRLLTYCSAAAPRRSLMAAGLPLAALRSEASDPGAEAGDDLGDDPNGAWSAGTVAGPELEPSSPWWRPLSAMEREHLLSRAGEPYRDPSGTAAASTILTERLSAQALSGAEPASVWRRRWGLPGGAR